MRVVKTRSRNENLNCGFTQIILIVDGSQTKRGHKSEKLLYAQTKEVEKENSSIKTAHE